MKIYNNAVRGGAGWRVRLDDVHDVSDCLSPCPVTFLQPGQRFLFSGVLLAVAPNRLVPGPNLAVHAGYDSDGIYVLSVAARPVGVADAPIDYLYFADPTAQVLTAPYTDPNP